ncbi:haloacid dehalogenase type II [Pendulispora albinea]|uniref:Haloacid dehalogenase type II n=1 Tax=Pendulispora albinea TaxID=2741071 RepID=A0ABZ2LXS1_9BACT
MTRVKAYVFDAYGTVFDIHSAVRAHAPRLGDHADAISRLWRAKQLEYTWVRSLMRQHADFEAVTAASLDFAMASFGLADRALRAALLDAYRVLEAYPEVPGVLRALRRAGIPTAILSNGSPAMLERVVASAGLEGLFDALISVEEVGIYKPDPRVYQLAVDRLGVAAGDIGFHSSNAWDVAGARAFGLRVVWVNRTGQPDEYGLSSAKVEVRSLSELPELAGMSISE